jgi:hypothetical protein
VSTGISEPRVSAYRSILGSTVPIYRLHDTAGDDLGLLEHPAPNLDPVMSSWSRTGGKPS